jgi:hypothetical protein
MRLASILMSLLATSPGQATRGDTTYWMVVGASDPSPAGIARAAKALAKTSPRGLVFQTRDCGDKKNVFGVALDISDVAEAAQVALVRVRTAVNDAYIKRCAVVPRSLLSLRFPAVDTSIANVPDDAVNWDDSDRVSTAVPLADGRDVVAQRVFVDDPEDPLEGRRVRVLLVSRPDKVTVLSDDCTWPERFIQHEGQLAFQCAGEEAGDELLHTTLVFDRSGKQIAKVEHCRNPSLPDGNAVICSQESVNAKGRLKLRSQKLSLTQAKPAAQKPGP